MDGKASNEVADWLEVRFKDELKVVELRQKALLTELRICLGGATCGTCVRVTPPEPPSMGTSPYSGASPFSGAAARGLLRPELGSEQGDASRLGSSMGSAASMTSSKETTGAPWCCDFWREKS
eukprot:Skav229136  [mRNA]  locus=scaffold1875:96661:97029:+ [translate_table: standard]